MTPRTSDDSLADTLSARSVPDALAHTYHITDPAPETGATVRDVELLEGGEHQGEDYGDNDLDDIVANWNRNQGLIDAPAVIGHEEFQPLTQHADFHGHEFKGLGKDGFNTGSPAIGWLANVRLGVRPNRIGRPRKVVLADMHHVHPAIADLIRRKAYRKISPEFWDTPPEGAIKGSKGIFLRRVAILGGETPQIKTLNDLPMPDPVRRFSDAGSARVGLKYLGRVRLSNGRGWRCFSEVQPMPENGTKIGEPDAPAKTAERSATEAQLKGSNGHPQEVLAALASLPDDHFQTVAQHLLRMSPGWMQPGGRTAEPTAPGSHFMYGDGLTQHTDGSGTGINDNDWISRNAGTCPNKMGDGSDPNAVGSPHQPDIPMAAHMVGEGGMAGMPSVHHGNYTNLADDTNALPPDPGNMPLETGANGNMTLQAPPAPMHAMGDAATMDQTMGVNPLMPPNPSDRQPPNLPAPMHTTMADVQRTIKKMADAAIANTRAELNRTAAERLRAERLGQIRQLCDQAVRDNRLQPGDVDPHSRYPNWYHELVEAAGSPRLRRFGDKLYSEWDYLVWRLRGLPKLRRFSSREVIVDPDKAAGQVPQNRVDQLLKYTSLGRKILKDRAAR